jgi:hypothetical protein
MLGDGDEPPGRGARPAAGGLDTLDTLDAWMARTVVTGTAGATLIIAAPHPTVVFAMTGAKQPKRHLHLVEDADQAPPSSPAALAPASYTNRFGGTYYLHQGTTKTGRLRYFVARTAGAGALSVMPEGYEFAESLNGVVSVKRSGGQASRVPDADLEVVRRELARHPHLRHYAADVRKDEIVVHEPLGLPAENDLDDWARTFAMPVEAVRRRLEERAHRTRYAPVMKFIFASAGESGEYRAYRRHYRGEGGWWVLSHGPLLVLLRKYLPHLGTETSFELM